MKNPKTTDLNKTLRISLQDLATKFTTTLPKLLQICETLGIDFITKHDTIYIDRITKDYTNAFTEIESYIKYEDIEEKVLKYIQDHQGTTAYSIMSYFKMSSNFIDKIVANLTYTEPLLWSDSKGTSEFLYYGYENWEG